MRDVAERAGVSPMTVSRALNTPRPGVGRDAGAGGARRQGDRLPAESPRQQPVVEPLDHHRPDRPEHRQLDLHPDHQGPVGRHPALRLPAHDLGMRLRPGGGGGTDRLAAHPPGQRPGAPQYRAHRAGRDDDPPVRRAGRRKRQSSAETGRHGGELLQPRRRLRDDHASRPAGLPQDRLRQPLLAQQRPLARPHRRLPRCARTRSARSPTRA